MVAQREKKIERPAEVVYLGEGGVRQIDHRERRAALLRKVHQRLRLNVTDQVGDGARIAEGHRPPVDPVARQAAPQGDALGHRLDRNQALGSALAVPAAANQAVDADDVMPGRGKMERGGPTEIAVDPEHDDGFLTHRRTRMVAREHEISMRALSAFALRAFRSRGLAETEFLAGQRDTRRHVAQLLERHFPGSGAQAAVGGHVNARRITEDLDRVEHPIPDQLRRLDEVAVDVEHAQTERRLIRQISEFLDHLVARPGLIGGPGFAAVVVGEADGELPALRHPLDRREEQVVVAEAEVGGEHGVQTLDAGIEAVDEEVELVGLGRRPRLIDLDPARAQADQRHQVGPDQVAGDFQDEVAASGLALAASIRGGLSQVGVDVVATVERPVGYGVGAGHRDLQLGVGHRDQIGELGVVERRLERDRRHDGRLAVVLVVERPDAATALEAVAVADGPVVHLGALLLAVVDDVEAGALLELQRVEAGPALEIGFLFFAEGRVTQQVDQLSVVRDLEPLAPAAGFLEIAIAQRLAGVGLHPPGRLVQGSDLVRQQGPVVECAAHTDTSCFTLRAASPSRCTFRSATTVGRNASSQLEDKYRLRGRTVSARWRATSTVFSTDSSIELRPSMTPATRPLSQPEPSSLTSVSTRSTPMASTGRRRSWSTCGPASPK